MHAFRNTQARGEWDPGRNDQYEHTPKGNASARKQRRQVTPSCTPSDASRRLDPNGKEVQTWPTTAMPRFRDCRPSGRSTNIRTLGCLQNPIVGSPTLPVPPAPAESLLLPSRCFALEWRRKPTTTEVLEEGRVAQEDPSSEHKDGQGGYPWKARVGLKAVRYDAGRPETKCLHVPRCSTSQPPTADNLQQLADALDHVLLRRLVEIPTDTIDSWHRWKEPKTRSDGPPKRTASACDSEVRTRRLRNHSEASSLQARLGANLLTIAKLERIRVA